MTQPILNTLGRVFINKKTNDFYKFYNCMKVGSIDQDLGASEYITVEGVDGKKVVVGVMKQQEGNVTTSLSGTIPIDAKSNIETLKRVPSFDMQIHYGICGRPDNFHEFSSAIILNDALLLNYSISDAVTTTPTERAVVQENASIIATSMYRVLNPGWQEVYSEPPYFIENIQYYKTSDCEGIYSDSTWLGIEYSASDFKHLFLYSKDDGKTWVSNYSNGNPHTTSPLYAGMAIVNDKVFWSVYNFTSLFVYVADVPIILAQETIVPEQIYSEIDTSINDMYASNNFVWCAGGQFEPLIMSINAGNHEITKYNILEYTTQPMRVVHALNDNFVLFGGDDSIIMSYQYGTWFKHQINVEEESSVITDIVALSETHWIAINTWNAYITFDGGRNWRITLSLKNDWNVAKFDFYDATVGYLTTETKVYRTMDGGNSWGLVSSIGVSSEPSSICISSDDVNKIMVAKFNGKVYAAS